MIYFRTTGLPHSISYHYLGKLSSAILDGILSSLLHNDVLQVAHPIPDPSVHAVVVIPTAFTACVRQHHSATLLKQKYEGTQVEVLTDQNVLGVQQGDVIILGVEPNAYEEVLTAPGMREALSGKILVSILGGVSTRLLADTIYSQKPLTDEEKANGKHCQIIRVLPNTAAATRDSISLIIEEEKDQYPPNLLNPIASLFKRVGTVKMWDNRLGPAGATLCASSGAFFALFLEGVVDGAVKLGIDRKEALQMAAVAMRGTANLLARGEDPSEVRKKVATPGGSTAVGLKCLEDRNVKGLIEEAFLKTVEKASGRGQKKAAE